MYNYVQCRRIVTAAHERDLKMKLQVVFILFVSYCQGFLEAMKQSLVEESCDIQYWTLTHEETRHFSDFHTYAVGNVNADVMSAKQGQCRIVVCNVEDCDEKDHWQAMTNIQKVYVIGRNNHSKSRLLGQVDAPVKYFSPMESFTVCPDPLTGKSMAVKRVEENCITTTQGLAFNVSAFGLPPYIIWNSESITGIDVDVLKILADKMQFSFTVIKEPNWGQRIDDTDQWSGVIGSVRNRHIVRILYHAQ